MAPNSRDLIFYLKVKNSDPTFTLPFLGEEDCYNNPPWFYDGPYPRYFFTRMTRRDDDDADPENFLRPDPDDGIWFPKDGNKYTITGGFYYDIEFQAMHVPAHVTTILQMEEYHLEKEIECILGNDDDDESWVLCKLLSPYENMNTNDAGEDLDHDEELADAELLYHLKHKIADESFRHPSIIEDEIYHLEPSLWMPNNANEAYFFLQKPRGRDFDWEITWHCIDRDRHVQKDGQDIGGHYNLYRHCLEDDFRMKELILDADTENYFCPAEIDQEDVWVIWKVTRA